MMEINQSKGVKPKSKKWCILTMGVKAKRCKPNGHKKDLDVCMVRVTTHLHVMPRLRMNGIHSPSHYIYKRVCVCVCVCVCV